MLCIPGVYYHQVENSGGGYINPMYTYTTIEPGGIVEQKETRNETILAIAELLRNTPRESGWIETQAEIQDAIRVLMKNIVEEYEPQEEDDED